MEGSGLSSFCESTEVTTSCWPTINKRTPEPTKKDTPYPKAETLQQGGVGDTVVDKIESLTHQVKWKLSVMSHSLRPSGLYSPWNSAGQNTGVGSLALIQGIFPTQGSNPGLQHRRQILYQLSHKGSPRILEWVAYPFSRRSSRPRNRTRVSCTAGRFFTNWATREALTPLPGIELLSPVLEGDVLSTGLPENLFETICLSYVLEEEEIFSF